MRGLGRGNGTNLLVERCVRQRVEVKGSQSVPILQLDRFEEDLNVSRVRLRAVPSPSSVPPASPELSEEQRAAGRQRALQLLAELRAKNAL